MKVNWQRKTEAAFVANVRSILTPLVGMDLGTGQKVTDPNRANRVQATPHDLATILLTGLQERGFKITPPRPEPTPNPLPLFGHGSTGSGDGYDQTPRPKCPKCGVFS